LPKWGLVHWDRKPRIRGRGLTSGRKNINEPATKKKKKKERGVQTGCFPKKRKKNKSVGQLSGERGGKKKPGTMGLTKGKNRPQQRRTPWTEKEVVPLNCPKHEKER